MAFPLAKVDGGCSLENPRPSEKILSQLASKLFQVMSAVDAVEAFDEGFDWCSLSSQFGRE
jgi:hypothetical protein